ncbi:hypothetical protein HanPSC8_Chr06g0245491 [Helianthus annuus]|nr:hypothetical protein HanPSC8_Chr06g0245491 [Helianthus annuus]
MDNAVYDEDSITGNKLLIYMFAGLDNVVEMKQPADMKSSNIVGNLTSVWMVICRNFLIALMRMWWLTTFLWMIIFKRRAVHVMKLEMCVVADNTFVDDHFQKLSKISDETGDFEELFGVLPDLTMSSIGAAKNKSKGFDLEFGALVGCPDNSIKHEINKVGSISLCLVVFS